MSPAPRNGSTVTRVALLEAGLRASAEDRRVLYDLISAMDTKCDNAHDTLWRAIQNRLPLWATMMIAGLTAAVGALSTALSR